MVVAEPESVDSYQLLMDDLTLTEVVLGTTSVDRVQNITLDPETTTQYKIVAEDKAQNKTEYTVNLSKN